MGQNATFRAQAWSDGARLDELRFPQVPMESEKHPSNPPRTDVTEVKGEEVDRFSANHSDPVAGIATSKLIGATFPSRTADEISLGGSFDGTRSLSEVREVGGLPPPAIKDARAELNLPAGRHCTSQLDVGFCTARSAFQIQDMQRSLLVKEEEIATLQKQNQQFREVMNRCMSRAGQVVEIQETMRKIKTAARKLHEDVNSLPSSPDDFLSFEIGKICSGEVHCDKCPMHEEDLLRSHRQLGSARQEAVQLKENIVRLEAANSKLEQKVEKIQRQLCKEKAGQHGSYVDGQQSPFLWESTAKDMLSSIAAFIGQLSKYIDSNGQNPARTFILESVCSGRGPAAQDRHWKHLLKNFVCEQLLSGFEYERFSNSANTVLFLDNDERGRDCFEYFQEVRREGTGDKAARPAKSQLLDSLFFEYFQALRVLPSDGDILRNVFSTYNDLIETSRRNMLLEGAAENPRCQRLVSSFITVTKLVWDFHKLCLSFESPATIFRVAPGEPFNAVYMESIDTGDSENCSSDSVPKVSFMTFPGFRLRKSIVKCQVFLLHWI